MRPDFVLVCWAVRETLIRSVRVMLKHLAPGALLRALRLAMAMAAMELPEVAAAAA